jgi:uncharacterized membrane protein (UPF0127 family)
VAPVVPFLSQAAGNHLLGFLCPREWNIARQSESTMSLRRGLRRNAAPTHLGDGSTLLVAASRRERLRGLSGRESLPASHALLIKRCRSVHTAGMRFALDLLWLGADGAVVRLDREVKPRRLRTCLRARAVIECSAGCGERFAAALLRGSGPPTAGRAWQGRRERGVR